MTEQQYGKYGEFQFTAAEQFSYDPYLPFEGKSFTDEVGEQIADFLRWVVSITGIRDLINGLAGRFFRWGRRQSLWPLHIGLACCAIEFAAMGAPRFDVERLGMLTRSSPRQCDLLIVTGTVTKKMAPSIKLLYEQMPEPKYAIAQGACVIAGGPFYDAYSMIPGIDKLFPVDVYVPGCPPRPEALMDGAILLQGKIRKAKIEVFDIR